MAEETLASKQYQEVIDHLNKAEKLLGVTNIKIEYLRILNVFDLLQNPAETGFDKPGFYPYLNVLTQRFLNKYAKTEMKEQYAEVYRIKSKIESHVNELKKEYSKMYHDYKSYNRAIDSLNFLKKTNWLEENRGIDVIWTLGRTYDAIIGHYKNSVINRLNSLKQPITDRSNNISVYRFDGCSVPLKKGFTITSLNYYLPSNGEVLFSENIYIPSQAWFNESGRLFKIKYLRKDKMRPNEIVGMNQDMGAIISATKQVKPKTPTVTTTTSDKKFGPPIENAWHYYSTEWDRYITGSSIILEYFANEKETGLFISLPYNKIQSDDPDGKIWNSVQFDEDLNQNFSIRSNFYYTFNYETVINIGGIDATGNQKGALITEVNSKYNEKNGGLKVNDIITRFGYRKISSIEQLASTIFIYSPSETVEVEYLRNEKVYTTKVVIAKSE